MIKLRAKYNKATCAQSRCKRILLVTGFSLLLPFVAHAEAPVVDDSENFAIIEEQQATIKSPGSAKYETEDSYAQRTSSLDDELPLAVDDGDKSVANGDLKLIDQVHALQKEVQELRGQLEVQAHDVKLLQQQQLSFYKDLDGRLKGSAPLAVQAKPQPIIPAVIPTTIPTPKSAKIIAKPAQSISIGSNNPADEQISYLAAYELVKNKRFDDALAAMQTFVVQHPKGGYTANAHYWLGELYMVKNNYPKAIEQFTVVLEEFPTSSKSAASNLKMGYALAASGKKLEAIARLQQVVNNYPDTAAAQLAAVKLDALHVS
jgi:tol-pal system protein YbgF